MKIQIDTDKKIINVIGTVRISDLYKALSEIGISLVDYSIEGGISQTPIILSNPQIRDQSHLDPPFKVTCSGVANIANSPYCTPKASGDIIV
jgi:hypothetical protein